MGKCKIITGTFLDGVAADVPSNNWDQSDWRKQFDIFKNMGLDTVIIIRVGFKDSAMYNSPVMRPTIYEDDDLVELMFGEADRTGLKMYLGLYDSEQHWIRNNWEPEIDLAARAALPSGATEILAHEACPVDMVSLDEEVKLIRGGNRLYLDKSFAGIAFIGQGIAKHVVSPNGIENNIRSYLQKSCSAAFHLRFAATNYGGQVGPTPRSRLGEALWRSREGRGGFRSDFCN